MAKNTSQEDEPFESVVEDVKGVESAHKLLSKYRGSKKEEIQFHAPNFFSSDLPATRVAIPHQLTRYRSLILQTETTGRVMSSMFFVLKRPFVPSPAQE